MIDCPKDVSANAIPFSLSTPVITTLSNPLFCKSFPVVLLGVSDDSEGNVVS